MNKTLLITASSLTDETKEVRSIAMQNFKRTRKRKILLYATIILISSLLVLFEMYFAYFIIGAALCQIFLTQGLQKIETANFQEAKIIEKGDILMVENEKVSIVFDKNPSNTWLSNNLYIIVVSIFENK